MHMRVVLGDSWLQKNIQARGTVDKGKSLAASSGHFLICCHHLAISVCTFVALLKATYAEHSYIVLSSRYKKALIFNLLCVLIYIGRQLETY